MHAALKFIHRLATSLRDEAVWRPIEILLIVIGIIVGGILAHQQNEINERLLNVNFRILVDGKYNGETFTERFTNYGENPVNVEAVRLITDPPVNFSMGPQTSIFPQQYLDVNLKDHLSTFLKDYPDGFYGGAYQVLLFADTPAGRKAYVGQLFLSVQISEGKIISIIPSNNFYISEFDGNALDFINREK